MALISCPAPSNLSNIQVPGTKEPASELHITLCYLGDNVSGYDLVSAYKVVYDVCSKTSPITIVSDYTTTFPPAKKGYPVICSIESPELYALREQIAAGLKKCGVAFANDFIPYKPHCTLSYSIERPASVVVGRTWVVDCVNIWPQDKGITGQMQVPLFIK